MLPEDHDRVHRTLCATLVCYVAVICATSHIRTLDALSSATRAADKRGCSIAGHCNELLSFHSITLSSCPSLEYKSSRIPFASRVTSASKGIWPLHGFDRLLAFMSSIRTYDFGWFFDIKTDPDAIFGVKAEVVLQL